jgi:NhaP-type Na+/H+ or K+/H+ antiporter
VPDVALVLGLLVAVVVVVSLAGRLRIAYPILLVIAGGALALVPGLPEVTLNPELILVLFLPPLVYSTSLGTSRFELRANRRPILALAVGLVLLTMGAVALAAHLLIPGMSWPVALTLGAIVAPPDPIAASEVAGKVGLPSGLLSILEGEGLINDGTALTAYQLSLAAAVGTVTVASIGEAAVKAVVLGIGFGLLAGVLATRVLRLVEEPLLENTVLLMLPFAAYVPANALGGSGVLAVLTAGLWYLRDGRPVLSATGRLQQRSLWQLVAFLLSGLSFLLVGLELRDVIRRLGQAYDGLPGGPGRAVLIVGLLCLTVVVTRFVGVFGFAVVPGGRARLRREAGSGETADAPASTAPGLPEPRHRIRRNISWRSVTVISWAGMRGAVSLAAALAVPQDLPYRDVLIAVTFAVIVVTLVGQGLTLPFLVRRLKVVSPAREAEFDLLRARHRLTVAGLQRLQELDESAGGGRPSGADPVDDDEAEDDPAAEALARASALYQRQLDRIERRLALFADGAADADGENGVPEPVPDPEAARATRAALPTVADPPGSDGYEDAVRAAFRADVDAVRETQRVELERLELRGAVGHQTADHLRSRLDAAELSLPSVPHV